MQKPAFEDFGLTQEKYHGAIERNRKVSLALTHYLPLAFGTILGIAIYIIYYKPFSHPDYLEIVKSFFVFGGFGLIFLGLPLFFFKVVEKFYFKIISKRPEQVNITKYDEHTEKYDYWRLRTDEDLWRGMQITGFRSELQKVFTSTGYQAIHRNGLSDTDDQFDFLLYKDYRLIPVKCYSQVKPVGVAPIRLMHKGIKSLELKYAVCASSSGFTKQAAKFAHSKNIKLITPKEITEMLKST
jgi:restriction endonuclease